MSKQALDAQIAALEQLRQAGASPSVVEQLRKALANRNNFVVAKAAAVIGSLSLTEMIPDLLTALPRFYEDPVKTDPKCWAKEAIIKTLAELNYEASGVYMRGLRYVQPEPVWGGHSDSAATLRSRCASALVSCRDLSNAALLEHLLESLVDTEKNVRIAAARAIGRVPSHEASLLLRLRALQGDTDDEMMGALLSSILEVEGVDGIPFVARFLEKDSSVEAAFALALMRQKEALDVLITHWTETPLPNEEWLTAIAVSQLPEAFDFLLEIVKQGGRRGTAARKALESVRLPESVQERLQGLVM